MKRNQVVILIILCACCLSLVLTGCSSNMTPTDKNMFAKTMTGLEYQVEDQSSMIRPGQAFTTVYLAHPVTVNETDATEASDSYAEQYQVEFYEFKDADSCKETYDTMVNEQKAVYKDKAGYSISEKHASNGDVMQLSTNNICFRIAHCETTLLIGIAPKEAAAQIDTVFEQLGY